MQNVLITGGTGTIGTKLATLLLQRGYSVTILSRAGNGLIPGVAYAAWDINKKHIDPNAIANADYIIHLAGAGVADKRWTSERKKAIVDSRVNSGQLLVEILQNVPNKVKAIIGASAIGWYGPDTNLSMENGFDETAPAYTDFLGTTCKQWEESLQQVNGLGKRLVQLRTGIVLSTKGGALVEFLKPLAFRVAALLGSGKQFISWIHVDDLCNQYIYAIENEQMQGVYNAVAPHPVTNEALTLQLAKQKLGRFFFKLKVPSFLLQIVLGEMSIEVLKSTKVNAQKIQDAGFIFQYPTIEAAVQQLI